MLRSIGTDSITSAQPRGQRILTVKVMIYICIIHTAELWYVQLAVDEYLNTWLVLKVKIQIQVKKVQNNWWKAKVFLLNWSTAYKQRTSKVWGSLTQNTAEPDGTKQRNSTAVACINQSSSTLNSNNAYCTCQKDSKCIPCWCKTKGIVCPGTVASEAKHLAVKFTGEQCCKQQTELKEQHKNAHRIKTIWR